jgi:anti-anti-sigma factor
MDKSSQTAFESDFCWVVSPSGYFNSDAGAELKVISESFLGSKAKRFIVDCSRITMMNSLGVSYLTEILELTGDADRELAFCNCPEIIRKTLKLVGIDQYSRIFPDRKDAILQDS